MLLGLALTQHCNLRCPHCIRDDVTSVKSLSPELVREIVRDARGLFGEVRVSFTGGEPTLHKDWEAIVADLAAQGVGYRFVSNGWHMRRLMPILDRYPPAHVRLSLSGATEEVHDEERGRGSFRRVLLAVALLTSRRIPVSLSLVVDRRSRHELRIAAELAESLGAVGLQFILPQPVPATILRGSDFAPGEWRAVRDEVLALAAEPRRTVVGLDYGAPSDGPEVACDTFTLGRAYVDAHGRLSLCCQLNDYGPGDSDVVADLHETPLREAWPAYLARLDALRAAQAPAAERTVLDAFPCMRCARATGKLEWLRQFPESEWSAALGPAAPAPGTAVPIPIRRGARRVAVTAGA